MLPINNNNISFENVYLSRKSTQLAYCAVVLSSATYLGLLSPLVSLITFAAAAIFIQQLAKIETHKTLVHKIDRLKDEISNSHRTAIENKFIEIFHLIQKVYRFTERERGLYRPYLSYIITSNDQLDLYLNCKFPQDRLDRSISISQNRLSQSILDLLNHIDQIINRNKPWLFDRLT